MMPDISNSSTSAIFRNLSVDEEHREILTELLNSAPDLRALIDEAVCQVRRHFGAAELVLTYLEDPEDEAGNSVILAVQRDLPQAEVMKLNRAFRSEWWYANSWRADGKLVILAGGK